MTRSASEHGPGRRLCFKPFVLICLLIASIVSANSQKLPFQRFTAADGLAQDNVNRIVRDSRGFLWFCTGDGLSRFDGNRFKNYTQEQGLSHRSINDLLETSSGEYLVATSGGISILDQYGAAIRWDAVAARLEDHGGVAPLFTTFVPPENPNVRSSSAVNALEQHPDGTIYAATNQGLFKFVGEGVDRRYERVAFPGLENSEIVVNELRTDRRGDVWVATVESIYRINRSGVIERVEQQGGNSIFEDRNGDVWVDSGGNDLGIRVFRVDSDGVRRLHVFTIEDGLIQNGFTNAIGQAPDGKIYVGSGGVLMGYDPDAVGRAKFVAVDSENSHVGMGVADGGGDLWIATFGRGVLKLPVSNISSFPTDPTKVMRGINGLGIDRTDRPYLTTDEAVIYTIADGKLISVSPQGLSPRSWGLTFLDFQDKNGEWWIVSLRGLHRYPSVGSIEELAHTPAKKIYAAADGLGQHGVFNIFEDSRGDIWVTSLGKHIVNRWDRASDTMIDIGILPGTSDSNGAVTAYGEDKAGNVWISYYFGGLGRFRNGEFRMFTAEDGFPGTSVTDFHADRSGRLWIATGSRGVFRIDDPDSEAPTFRNVSTREGLLSNGTLCLAEDPFGRIYMGTGRGLHQLDPESGTVNVYTERDGLAGNYVHRCREDSKGNIWFVASNVLTRLTAAAEHRSIPPGTFIDGFAVNGNARRISELGETELKEIDLDAGENRIAISYFALGSGSGNTPRYQYRVGGGEWSAPSDASSATFDLAPGRYEVAVRALWADGTVSEKPATASFSIAYPIWQRWWFLLLAFLLVGGSIIALDRYRVSKTHQVEAALTQSRESETRFRTLADTASDAIITIDEESMIVFVNQGVERVFGYSPEELVGQRLTMLMPERMRPEHDKGLGRYIRSTKRSIDWSGVTLPGLHKDGHEIPLELSFGEFEREGKRFFTGIARDITERLRAEEELRRAREERMSELQRVRSRIATDLHDDIGSSLTQIAVLSEVARGQASGLQADGVSTPLERIKHVSKELVAVMSDIVWAINPQKDYLNDLVQRMRRFGSDVLSGRGVGFEFDAPEMDGSIELGANIRREVFAIYKESINNAVKYSECTKVVTSFSVADGELRLRVADDGKGFDTAHVLSDDFRPEMGGNGLASIRRRAKELGGICEIESAIGQGTEISVVVPI